MSRRAVVLILSVVVVLGTAPLASAADDAPNRCSQATTFSPVGSWISGTIGSSTDVDWYRFDLPKRQLAQYVLGGLPANYRMDVYRACGQTGSFHFHDSRPGTQFEELFLNTNYDPYVPAYVRISGVSGASGNEPYRLRVRLVPDRLSILSSHSFVDASGRHIVGEVFSQSEFRRVRVTATLYDSSGAALGAYTVRTMLRELESWRERRRTPFEIVFDQPPGYDHYRLSVTGRLVSVDPVARLKITMLEAYLDEGGVGHFPGRVNNNNAFPVDLLDVFVTLYDDRARVINVGAAATAKEYLDAGERSRFDATFESHFGRWNRWRAVAQAVAAQ